MVSLDLPLCLLSALQNLFNADETKKNKQLYLRSATDV